MFVESYTIKSLKYCPLCVLSFTSPTQSEISRKNEKFPIFFSSRIDDFHDAYRTIRTIKRLRQVKQIPH